MKKHYFFLVAFLTLSICSLDAQVLGYAICFDGVNDFAPVYRSGRTDIFGDNSDNDDLTIEFWVKDNGSGGDYIYSKHHDSGTAKEGFFIRRSGTGSITAGMAADDNTWKTVTGTRTVNDSNWHHVAVTYSLTSRYYILYIDGYREGHVNAFTAVFGNSLDARLSSSEHENSYFQGSFDEVRVWNSVRTLIEINASMNTELDLTTIPSDLKLYYKCNEGIPDTDNWLLYQLVDHSGNGVTGDLWNVFRLGTCSNWVATVPDATLSTETFGLTNSTLAVYPNPAKNTIKINGLKTNESYAIYNTLGAVVKKGTASNNEVIAIDNLTNGMYFLKLEDNRTLKFIKK